MSQPVQKRGGARLPFLLPCLPAEAALRDIRQHGATAKSAATSNPAETECRAHCARSLHLSLCQIRSFPPSSAASPALCSLGGPHRAHQTKFWHLAAQSAGSASAFQRASGKWRRMQTSDPRQSGARGVAESATSGLCSMFGFCILKK